MSGANRIAVALLVAAAACARVRHAPPSQAEPSAGEEPQDGRGGGVPPAPGRPRVPASPEGLLRPEAIADLQRALARRGLLAAHGEGDLDAPTTAAVRKFQQEQGLAATGFPDRETLRALGVSPEKAYVRPKDRERAEGQRGERGERGERAPAPGER